jgi:hypothetical protein
MDAEFNGFGGELISLALIREDNEAIYLVYKPSKQIEEDGYERWVAENVIPILWKIPEPMPGMAYPDQTRESGARIIQNFLAQDKTTPTIVADWPEDISKFCEAIMIAPGQMASIPQINFALRRFGPLYPTTVKGAIQHNAYHDAQVLRMRMLEK